MDITYPFTPGTRAVAQQVNQNFADVKSAVDPLQTAVSDIQTQLTSGIVLPDGSVDFTRLQSYATYVVSNATNATPIVITAVAHSFLTGDKVQISGVGGNTAANGIFTITKIGADTFSLDDSVGNGTFDSNGTAIIYPSADDNLVNKVYVDTKQLLDLGTVTTETTLTTGKITLADFSGAVNLVMPSDLPIGVEHTGIINFTTSLSSSPVILQTTVTKTITGATNASPIVITANSHGYITGDKVVISSVGGNTNANGTWVITKLTDNTFSLNTSSGNAAYTSGGTARKANFKWSDKNQGKAPTVYSIISGVRNVLVFKTHDGGSTWEVEYSTYGAIELNFDQPILTANGTIGGASFAVQPSTTSGTLYAYNVTDRNNTTMWASTVASGSMILYNPIAIKATGILIYNGITAAATTYGSNDNVTYTLLSNVSPPGNSESVISIPEQSQAYYKYYKYVFNGSSGGADGYIYELRIIGTYISA